jgi:hypothetical protein
MAERRRQMETVESEIFTRGQRVRMRNHPEWSLGEILEDCRDGTIRVFFEKKGERSIPFPNDNLILVEGDDAISPRLDKYILDLGLHNPKRAFRGRTDRGSREKGMVHTIPIAGNSDFQELSEAVDGLLSKFGLTKLEHKGSHSWLPPSSVPSNETWFKLCHYGSDGSYRHRFGIREDLANKEVRERCPDRFPVPPTWDVLFYGFEVYNNKSSLDRINTLLGFLTQKEEE